MLFVSAKQCIHYALLGTNPTMLSKAEYVLMYSYMSYTMSNVYATSVTISCLFGLMAYFLNYRIVSHESQETTDCDGCGIEIGERLLKACQQSFI